MSTLWRREEFLRICSKEELAEKAQDIEVTIPVKKSHLTPNKHFENIPNEDILSVVNTQQSLRKYTKSVTKNVGCVSIALSLQAP